MIAILQNFQFVPPTLTFPINTRMVVKIGKNIAQSNIYSGSDRFFVIGVEGMGTELAESDPLYETQSFEFQFECSGLFVIRCLNYPQAKCHVQVMGSSCSVTPVCLQEVFVYRKRSPPKNKVMPASERPFRITECDVQMFQGVVGECVESEDEDAYVDRMRQGQKSEKQVASPPIMKHVSRYEALSEQRQRTVPEVIHIYIKSFTQNRKMKQMMIV